MYLISSLSDLQLNVFIIFYIAVKLIYLNLPVVFAVRPNTIGYEAVKLIRNEKWS